MAKGKKHTPEQIVSLLRQIEVAVANGKTTPIACREGGITEQTYYRWRKEFGGLQVDQARRLKELERLVLRAGGDKDKIRLSMDVKIERGLAPATGFAESAETDLAPLSKNMAIDPLSSIAAATQQAQMLYELKQH